MQTAEPSIAGALLTFGVWGAVALVEVGFLWLFLWLFYSREARALNRARVLAIALALLGIVLTPSGAYFFWFTLPSPQSAWAQPTRTKAEAAVVSSTAAPFNLSRASAERGKQLFQEMNCIACHRVQGRGGAVAPDLWEVANRRDSEWIFKHFKNPQAVSPGTLMPRFPLPDEAFMDLTAYLLTLRDNP
ncbi:MAG: cytochrome c [Chloroflexi bacterium]|nr:cytochrome c [Chloroflexota bacterium]